MNNKSDHQVRLLSSKALNLMSIQQVKTIHQLSINYLIFKISISNQKCMTSELVLQQKDWNFVIRTS